MQVDVETLSPVSKKLTVTLDKERVDKAFEDAYRTLSRTVQIKGFRPGKVPRSLIERRYGPALSQEIADKLVDETVEKAFTEVDLMPVGGVSVEKDEACKGNGFRYEVRFDVAPELPEIALTGLSVSKKDTEPTDEELAARLEEARKSRTELVPVEDRGADTGDVVTLGFVGKLDGEPFKGGSAVDHELELGAGQFIPGFEDQLIGIRADEAREVSVTFPDDYHAPHLAGKLVTFDVTVGRVRHKEVPDLDDELARDLAYDSLEDMRAKVAATIREEKEAEAKSDLARQALEQLVGRLEFPVAPSMIDSRVDALAERLADDFRRQGIDPAMLNLGAEAQREYLKTDAERQVREQLILEKIAKDNELTISDEELETHLSVLAEKTGRAIQWVRSNFGTGARAEAFKQQLVRDKVLDFVVAHADVGSAAVADGAPDSEGDAATATDTVQTEEQP